MTNYPMTKQQFEREKFRLAREASLRLLESARINADPNYAATAAGLWLRMIRSHSLKSISNCPAVRARARVEFDARLRNNLQTAQ